MSTDLLIALLQVIESDDSIQIVKQRYDVSHPLVAAAIYTANDCLTGDDHHKNLQRLKRERILIIPGEQDRFGWLTGIIKLERGDIVFG